METLLPCPHELVSAAQSHGRVAIQGQTEGPREMHSFCFSVKLNLVLRDRRGKGIYVYDKTWSKENQPVFLLDHCTHFLRDQNSHNENRP